MFVRALRTGPGCTPRQQADVVGAREGTGASPWPWGRVEPASPEETHRQAGNATRTRPSPPRQAEREEDEQEDCTRRPVKYKVNPGFPARSAPATDLIKLRSGLCVAAKQASQTPLRVGIPSP